MATRQYIGARYVPIFDGDWDITKEYDPLVIVSYQGNSYTSRTFVPSNVDISDTTYWALTGNYNAQVEAYRQETLQMVEYVQEHTVNIQNSVADLVAADPDINSKIVTLGFYEPEDGGAAIYEIKSTGTASPDCIQISAGKYAHLQILDKTVNVKQLGAKGDGVTDDSTVLQYALDNYDHIIIPSTDDGYYITTQLTLTRKGLIIEGTSYDRISSVSDVKPTIVTDQTIASLIDITGAYGVIKNICFYGKGQATACITGTMSHFTFERVSTVSGDDYGFNIIPYLVEMIQCDAYYCDTNFYIHGVSTSAQYTSTKLTGCYSIDGRIGFLIRNMIYSSLDTCACDNASETSYVIRSSRGLTINNCGCEQINKAVDITTPSGDVGCRGITFSAFSIVSRAAGATADCLIELGVTNDLTFEDLYVNVDTITVFKSASAYSKFRCTNDTIKANRINLSHPELADFPFMHRSYSVAVTVTSGNTSASVTVPLPSWVNSDFRAFGTVMFGSRYESTDQIEVTRCTITGSNLTVAVRTNQPQTVGVNVLFFPYENSLSS